MKSGYIPSDVYPYVIAALLPVSLIHERGKLYSHFIRDQKLHSYAHAIPTRVGKVTDSRYIEHLMCWLCWLEISEEENGLVYFIASLLPVEENVPLKQALEKLLSLLKRAYSR